MIWKGKEVKIIKRYPTYVLVEHKAGYKECIHIHDLGEIVEVVEPPRNIAKIKHW